VVSCRERKGLSRLLRRNVFPPQVARAPRQLISNVNARTSDEIKGEPSNAYMSLHYINYSLRARTWRSRWSVQRLPAPVWHWKEEGCACMSRIVWSHLEFISSYGALIASYFVRSFSYHSPQAWEIPVSS
jgi:hypothetical protein